MEYRKEDYIYNLSYKGKVTHYLDDVLFQDDKTELKLAYECPRVSEMAPFIEEFVVGYLSEDDFERDSIITLDCGTVDYAVGTTPEIINNDSSSVYLFQKKQSTTDVFGVETIIINYMMEVDIHKSHKVISQDIKQLEKENPFFSFYKMVGSKFNIKNDKNLCALIGSARLDLMSDPDYSFMIMEYSHLRKYVPLSQELAFRTISKIYNFLPTKIK